jgi:hypothetical protein
MIGSPSTGTTPLESSKVVAAKPRLMDRDDFVVTFGKCKPVEQDVTGIGRDEFLQIGTGRQHIAAFQRYAAGLFAPWNWQHRSGRRKTAVRHWRAFDRLAQPWLAFRRPASSGCKKMAAWRAPENSAHPQRRRNQAPLFPLIQSTPEANRGCRQPLHSSAPACFFEQVIAVAAEPPRLRRLATGRARRCSRRPQLSPELIQVHVATTAWWTPSSPPACFSHHPNEPGARGDADHTAAMIFFSHSLARFGSSRCTSRWDFIRSTGLSPFENPGDSSRSSCSVCLSSAS